MLEPILAATRHRIDVLPPVSELRARAADLAPARDFAGALAVPGLAVIAEIKRRSPSAGDIAPGLDPVARVASYAAGGAAAISVLTEPEFFGGSLDDLAAVRKEVDVPILRKDFTLDSRQIWEARVAGADAVLLIVAALDRDRLGRLHDVAGEAGLAALVEVHTPAEAETALDLGADIVGVNNRDLTTFVTDLAVAEAVAPMLADVPVTVGESGVSNAAGAERMAAAGYDAILVGEALVRAPDPATLLSGLRSAGAP